MITMILTIVKSKSNSLLRQLFCREEMAECCEEDCLDMGGLDYGDEDDECEDEEEDMVMEKKSIQKESFAGSKMMMKMSSNARVR